MNPRLEHEDTIVAYIGTLREIYHQLEQYGRSATPIDVFDILKRGLPNNQKWTKHQIQNTLNLRRMHYAEQEELIWQLDSVKQIY